MSNGWTDLSRVSSPPPARSRHGLVVDQDRLYVFGGYGMKPVLFEETFFGYPALDLPFSRLLSVDSGGRWRFRPE